MRVSLTCLFILLLLCETAVAQTVPSPKAVWPRPVPVRIHDSSNKDLMVMTLGPVKSAIADGAFDPATDTVRLKDGSLLKNYYRDTLKIKYYKPIEKSRFPLPPSGWCSWYFYYQEIGEGEVKR